MFHPTHRGAFVLVGAAVLLTCLAPAAANAAVRAEPAILEYGVARPGSEQTQTVTLTNGGTKPVKLTNVKVECEHCTRVTFRPTELAPGKSLKAPVMFAPPDKERGAVDRTVTFETDDPDKRHVTVRMRAYVTDTAGLWPSQIVYAQPQAPGQKLRREIELVNVSNEPVKMLYATSPLNGPRVSVGGEPVPPGKRGKITVEWALPSAPGEYTGSAVVYLDHPKLRKLNLPYSAKVQPPASAPKAAPAEKPAAEPAKSANRPQAAAPRPQRAAAAAAAPPRKPTTAKAVPPKPAGAKLVRLELKDGLTLRDFVEVFATQLKLNLVYDEAALNVPVAVRLVKPLEEDALLPLLKSVLQAKGMALVSTERPEIWRIVAVKEAPPAVGLGQAASGAAAGPNQLVTEVLTPARTDVNTLANVLKGFVTAGAGQVTAVPEAGLLIVTDYKTQVDRLRGLVKTIDQGGAEDEFAVAVVPVRSAEVTPLLDRVNKLLAQLEQARGGAPKPREGKLFLTADPQQRQIVMVGRTAEFPGVREMIQQFDTAPGLTRATYRPEPDRFARASAAVRQVLGPAADETGPDGLQQMVVVGTAALSGAATEGQHQQIEALIREDESESELNEELVLKVYRVKNRDAAEIESTMLRLIGFAAPAYGDDGGGRAGSPFSAAADPLTDTGVRRVGNVDPAGARATAAPDERRGMLPPPPRTPRATTRPSSSRAEGRGAEAIDGGSEAPPFNIALDVGTNSLLIAATPRLHRKIRELIEQLDQRQAQVLLEVMLVSVSDTDTFSYAVEAALETTIRGGIVDVGTDFGIGQGPLNNRTLGVGPGLNGAVLNPGEFTVFLRALAQTNQAKVLSLPQVLALDNKPAVISSVQQQPFTSINASDTVSTTSFGGFAEAGTTLEITPHIAPADYLNIEYRLEVSSFTGDSPSPSVPPPRRSDAISSFISVPDGHTVIVGGLRSDSRTKGVSKVPGLGDIPILGILGRSENRSKGKSTFYIFVRPSILRASQFEDLKALSQLPRDEAGLPGDFPASEPQYIRE